MHYYKLNEHFLFSRFKIDELQEISKDNFKNNSEYIYFLNKLDINTSRVSFSLTDPSLMYIDNENINLLNKVENSYDIDEWLLNKIYSNKVKSININHPNWRNNLNLSKKNKYKVNIFALGDVGGTLLTGLKLLGGDCIEKIGIYDRTKEKITRYEHEINQIIDPTNIDRFPEVYGIEKSELFDCDMFIFCASKGVPPVGSEAKDVRMIQFEQNSEIITEYARIAREKNFKGIFSVVSDPVDPLCKVVYLESNKNDKGEFDYKGLNPEQIRGYGLGVMNARAIYYAKKDNKTIHYLNEGRAFGPHGDGLIIADSIYNYNDEISNFLTEKAKTANLEVRKTGFKPYIAPALSSGSISIIATIKGDWHYSATYIGGVYFGSKNRLNVTGIELERLSFPKELNEKIENTYERLSNII